MLCKSKILKEAYFNARCKYNLRLPINYLLRGDFAYFMAKH